LACAPLISSTSPPAPPTVVKSEAI
jgi:hypothetical protein